MFQANQENPSHIEDSLSIDNAMAMDVLSGYGLDKLKKISIGKFLTSDPDTGRFIIVDEKKNIILPHLSSIVSYIYGDYELFIGYQTLGTSSIDDYLKLQPRYIQPFKMNTDNNNFQEFVILIEENTNKIYDMGWWHY